MENATLKTPPKITVQIWRPVIDRLNKKIEAACLRRDAYLNRVLEVELPWLDSEVSIANSERAQKFLAEQLDTLDRKIVSLALRPDLVEKLNEICRRKRIGRDTFFNRLFLLLAAQPKLIDRIFFSGDDWRTEVWAECKHDGPFFQNVFYPLEAEIDPFWPLRTSLQLYAERTGGEDWTNPETGEVVKVSRSLAGEPQPITSVYASWQGFTRGVFKDVDLTGLNVYLPDSWVPGTDAAEREKKTLDDMLDF